MWRAIMRALIGDKVGIRSHLVAAHRLQNVVQCAAVNISLQGEHRERRGQGACAAHPSRPLLSTAAMNRGASFCSRSTN